MGRARGYLLTGLAACLGALAPGGTGRAEGTQRLGCPAWGYAMTVPASWWVLNRCSNEGDASIRHIDVGMSVQLHPWWTDARSRTSIAADISYNQRPVLPITYLIVRINGTRFVAASSVVRADNDGRFYLMTELETYTRHHLYRIMGFVKPMANGPIATADVRTLDTAIFTTVITGVADNKPTPWNMGR